MPLGYGQLTPAFWVHVVSFYNFSFVIQQWAPHCLVAGKEKLMQDKTKEFEWKVQSLRKLVGKGERLGVSTPDF